MCKAKGEREKMMKKCNHCGELVGDSVTKCFHCGEAIPLTKKDTCTYRCRECGEPMIRASDKCIKCGGDAESIRSGSNEGYQASYSSDSIGCLGYLVAILFTPLSCIIAVLIYFSNGSEKAKQVAQISAITFICLLIIRFFLVIIF